MYKVVSYKDDAYVLEIFAFNNQDLDNGMLWGLERFGNDDCGEEDLVFMNFKCTDRLNRVHYGIYFHRNVLRNEPKNKIVMTAQLVACLDTMNRYFKKGWCFHGV